MSWEYLSLAVIALVIVLLVIFRKNPFVKLYWKYALILLPLAVLIILKIISGIKKPTGDSGSTSTTVPDPLAGKIQDIKDDLVEAQKITAIEVSAAKAKNNEVLKQLEEVKKIPDKVERRRRLAAMIG